MAAIFALVVIVVAYITVKYPTHLYEDIREKVDNIEKVIRSKALEDFIKEVIEKYQKQL